MGPGGQRPTGITDPYCGPQSAAADVARTGTGAKCQADTTDDNGVRKIEKNGRKINGPGGILSGHVYGVPLLVWTPYVTKVEDRDYSRLYCCG